MAIVIYNVCCNKVNKWITMCFTDSIIGHFHTFNHNYYTFLLFNPWLLPFHISIFFWKRKQIKLNKISLSHLAPLPTEYYNTWFKKTGQTRYSNCALFLWVGSTLPSDSSSLSELDFWRTFFLRCFLLNRKIQVKQVGIKFSQVVTAQFYG